jgi:hypothetical protein
MSAPAPVMVNVWPAKVALPAIDGAPMSWLEPPPASRPCCSLGMLTGPPVAQAAGVMPRQRHDSVAKATVPE